MGLVAAVGLAPQASAGAASSAGSGVVKPWSLQNEQGGYDVSRQQALLDAAAANLITAHK